MRIRAVTMRAVGVVLIAGSMIVLRPSGSSAMGDGFIENGGRFEADVHYSASFGDGIVFVTADALVFSFREARLSGGPDDPATMPGETVRRVALRMTAEDGSLNSPVGRVPRSGRFHYFGARKPDRARRAGETDARAYDARAYSEIVFPGFRRNEDLHLRLSGSVIRYRMISVSGGTPAAPLFDVVGGDEVVQLASGGILCRTPLGSLLQQPDEFDVTSGVIAWMPAGVPGESPGPAPLATYQFPFSSLLGGGGDEEARGAVTQDASGHLYVAGCTESSDFPVTLGVSDEVYGGAGDAYVACFDSSATLLEWCTFVGGSGWDQATSLAVGEAGEVAVAGFTLSNDFPVQSAVGDTTYGGGRDAFAVVLHATGSVLHWSRFLGGSDMDEAADIEFADSDLMIVGSTLSTDFPTLPGGFRVTAQGGGDGFLVRLSGNDGALKAGTYVGGVSSDRAFGLVVDEARNALLVGETLSADFTTTVGAFDRSYNGGTDGFALSLDPALSTLRWGTFIGGAEWDQCSALAIDRAGDVMLTGFTWSTNFPVTGGSFDTSANGGRDGFVASLASNGSSLLWGTYLGGSLNETCLGLATDAIGNAVVVGETRSINFPTTAGTYDSSPNGEWDAFVTRIRGTGNGLIWSTLVGGDRNDVAGSVALDLAGNPVVSGWTRSTNFPVTAGAFDVTRNGETDAYILKFAITQFTGVHGADPEPAAAAWVDLQAAPNPFAGEIRMEFTLPERGTATLSVLDVTGRSLYRIGPREFAAGRHLVAWNGHDVEGRSAPPGMYLLRLETGGRTAAGKVLRIR